MFGGPPRDAGFEGGGYCWAKLCTGPTIHKFSSTQAPDPTPGTLFRAHCGPKPPFGCILGYVARITIPRTFLPGTIPHFLWFRTSERPTHTPRPEFWHAFRISDFVPYKLPHGTSRLPRYQQ